jgi:hypothetical protein
VAPHYPGDKTLLVVHSNVILAHLRSVEGNQTDGSAAAKLGSSTYEIDAP